MLGSFTQEMLTRAAAHELHTSQAGEVLCTHTIQVIRQDDHRPMFLTMGKDTTVGAITVPEARYQSAATTRPFDQVFLKEMS